MPSHLFRTLLLILVLATNLATAAENIAPAVDWRLRAERVEASTETLQLYPLTTGMTAQWTIAPGSEEWIAVQLPKRRPKHLLITWQTSPRGVPVALDLYGEESGSWEAAEEKISGRYLEKFEVHNAKSRWVRLRFNAPPADSPLTVSNIALYELNPSRRDDYWLVIGASIQAQSIRQEVFHREVISRYPQYDPVIFNRAVGGWTSTNLLKQLPVILAEHPEATYVCIHIGGNNVSRDRPYPGGAELLESELEQILQLVEKSGKIPILSRLSYRAYQTKQPVPPEENGSGPYVENIYDPLIQKYCPRFYDQATGKGVVDAYGWFKDHPDQLSRDGVHVNPAGQISWNVLWADRAGAVIYARSQ